MNCHTCGARMSSLVTSLPFKTSPATIVILKNLPVIQCDNCSEYFLDDPVMERVDVILKNVDSSAELEVVSYAA